MTPVEYYALIRRMTKIRERAIAPSSHQSEVDTAKNALLVLNKQRRDFLAKLTSPERRNFFMLVIGDMINRRNMLWAQHEAGVGTAKAEYEKLNEELDAITKKELPAAWKVIVAKRAQQSAQDAADDIKIKSKASLPKPSIPEPEPNHSSLANAAQKLFHFLRGKPKK